MRKIFYILFLGIGLGGYFYFLHTNRSGGDYFIITLIGDSTAHGLPYTRKADIGLIVSHLFQWEFQGRKIMVVNKALPGASSDHVVSQAQKIKQTDVVLLYMGNNEFIKSSPPPDLRKYERNLFDLPSYDLKNKTEIIKKFEKNLCDIIQEMKRRKVLLILSTVAVNQKDWEPNRSCLTHPENKQTFNTKIGSAMVEYRRQEYNKALDLLLPLVKEEPSFAYLYKMIGDCYFGSKEFVKARKYYQGAIDYDGDPCRAVSEENEAIRKIAAENNIPVVDSEKILEEDSSDGLIGFNLMWDNCHPTLRGYLKIAEGFARVMEERFHIKRKIQELSVDELKNRLGFDEDFEFEVFLSRGMNGYAASTLIWDPRQRLEKSKEYLNNAGKIKPRDPKVWCAFAVQSLLYNDLNGAIGFWKKAGELDRDYTKENLNNKYIKQLLERSHLESRDILK